MPISMMGSVDADGGHEEEHEAQKAKPPRDAIFQRLGNTQPIVTLLVGGFGTKLKDDMPDMLVKFGLFL